jgi:hypothetical protein
MQLIYALALTQTALAATITYNWDITWVKANPDGLWERPVIGMPLSLSLPDVFGALLMLSRNKWSIPVASGCG